MSVEVIRPGLMTTVQDRGRRGYQQYGITSGGAMDLFALRAANLLVGNDEGDAALEATLAGPTLRFERAAVIAVCGGDLSPAVDGVPLPMWRPALVPAGAVLAFGRPRGGCRAYIAAAGGFAVPPVLGSRSADLRAGLGGGFGRALRAGDRLPLGMPSPLAGRIAAELRGRAGGGAFAAAAWRLPHSMLPGYAAEPVVRAVRGPHFGRFAPEAQEALFTVPMRVTPQSDRMGYRLEGPTLPLAETFEPISSAVSFGTVQVPPNGQPIVLMADRQPTGGYPVIAQVIRADLPLLAQLAPGKTLRFQEVSLQAAEELLWIRETEWTLFRQGMTMKYR